MKTEISCAVCKKTFIDHISARRKFCSHLCYSRSLLNDPSGPLGLHPTERQRRYRALNRDKTHNLCSECNEEKLITAKRCITCAGKAVRGENNKDWKGGYENHLWHNKQRRIKKLNAKGSHTLQEWQALKERYGYMCLCCKRIAPEITLTEDHIIPLSKGGSDYIENIQPLCRKCNSKKQTDIISFIEPSKLIMMGALS